MGVNDQRAPLTAQVELGQHVLTRDREELGIVARTTSKQFEVNPPHGGPYWLERQSIIAANGPEITVGFPYRELSKRRLKADQVDVTEGVTLSEVGGEGTLSAEEQLAQREIVERQLVEQRAQIAERGDSADEGSYGEPVESELERLEDEASDGPGRRTSRD